MDSADRFWNAAPEEFKRGYVCEGEYYICLLCGKAVEHGIVYPDAGNFYEAEKYMRLHIEREHHSVFEYLIRLDKKLTGLTEHQNSLLRLFYKGKSDKEIQQVMGIGSASTIRNHRFALKEKERQSKVFLTLMELLKDKDKHAPTFIDVHKTATMADDRYNITLEEKEAILQKYFPREAGGRLTTFHLKEKQKLVVLREIAKRFTNERIYSEREVNAILQEVYDDHVTLRRYLIEYGFLDRKPDGSEYWLDNGSVNQIKKE
ncbi:DUF2087 domain-containing protein [Paenibacillus sp. J2TS4]|uniref:DUF2087 domain-containing protein n=1 Tax=Paenibacillus sp. J2TS4 TaxID=2807194 RepID=UPI001B1550EF|nr:DUF2087 domain-containing protein [Paenibacillus sp. J2TS4]GIP34492.1 transcriptional regulator [Paenibacillus sp. J2TS4]